MAFLKLFQTQRQNQYYRTIFRDIEFEDSYSLIK